MPETPTTIKGPKWLKQAFADVYDKIEANKPISGIGTMVFDSAGGRPINVARAGAGAGAAAPEMPFQILANGENIGVLPESTLFKNWIGEKIAITGLLTRLSDGTISGSDEGWFPCPNRGGKIWLQIGTCAASGAAPRPLVLTGETTRIRSGEVGGTLWDEYPEPVAMNRDDPANPFQEFYNLLIAEVTDPETDTRPAIATVTVGEGESAEKRQVTQLWSRNVFPVTWIASGAMVVSPVDPTFDQPPTPL